MSDIKTVEDLRRYLNTLPGDMLLIKQKDALEYEFNSVSDASFMYVDKSYTEGPIDEIWDEEDLTDADPEEWHNFKQVLVLWSE